MKYSLRRPDAFQNILSKPYRFGFAAFAFLVLTPLTSPAAHAEGETGKTLGGAIVPRPNVILADSTGVAAQTAPAAPTPQPNATPPAALGPISYDLGAIKQMKVAGQALEDAPVRVGNLDVLAPLVPVLARVGASASRVASGTLPAGSAKGAADRTFQLNLPQGPPIILTIGSNVAKMGEEDRQLRAAPLVIRDKIWLPVFSLAPLMGASTRIEADGTLHLNPTVQSVELFPVKGAVALTVKTSMPLPPGAVMMGTLEDPPKLYLDFSGFSMGFDAAGTTAERIVSGGLGNVERVRVGHFTNFPDTTRVVLDLNREMTGVTQPLPDKTLFALVLLEPGKRLTTDRVFNPTPGSGNLRGITIVVDAGHGGHDYGALGGKAQEKNLTLTIANMLRDELMARGATVLMSRPNDTFISLQGRVDFANSQKADIFFSVHINSYQKTSAGTETFYYTPQSLALAREVHKELVAATGFKNRGVSQARFYVIRNTWMPSVLTESGFITNPGEENKMMDRAWQQRVAQGMAQGITNYVQNNLRGGVLAG